jgi:hypothetical protein
MVLEHRGNISPFRVSYEIVRKLLQTILLKSNVIEITSSIFRDIPQCCPVKASRHFGRAYRLHLQGWRISQAELATCFTLVSYWPILRPWTWRWHVPPEYRVTLNGVDGVISQKILSRIYDSVTNINGFWIGLLEYVVLRSLLITLNYSAIANLPTSQITRTRSILVLRFCFTPLYSILCPLIIPRHGPHRKHCLPLSRMRVYWFVTEP